MDNSPRINPIEISSLTFCLVMTVFCHIKRSPESAPPPAKAQCTGQSCSSDQLSSSTKRKQETTRNLSFMKASASIKCKTTAVPPGYALFLIASVHLTSVSRDVSRLEVGKFFACPKWNPATPVVPENREKELYTWNPGSWTVETVTLLE